MKNRISPGEVTMFKMRDPPTLTDGKSVSRHGSAKRLKRSTISQKSDRSRNSQTSKRSLNHNKRQKEFKQISQEYASSNSVMCKS